LRVTGHILKCKEGSLVFGGKVQRGRRKRFIAGEKKKLWGGAEGLKIL